MTSLSEISLQELFPEVPWDAPVKVTVAGRGDYFVCRYCIARHGLAAVAVDGTPYAFLRRSEAVSHIIDEHSQTP